MLGATTGFGGGKVILLGEHAVVHGAPAIAAGLSRGVTTVAKHASEDSLHIDPWGRTLRPNGDEPLARAFARVLELYGDRPSLRLEAHVDLPPGAGLGCSAAMGVSLIDAVDKTLGIERSRDAIAARALEWERFFHGSPSGIDNTTSAIGGLIRFQASLGVRRIHPKRPLNLVIAHSGQSSNTKEMVAQVSARLAERPVWARRTLDEVEGLVRDAEPALQSGDFRGLGSILDRNHGILCTLGLSTPRIESLRDTAKSAGAHGAKVTGAGGGGCIVALAEDGAHAGRIADALGTDSFVEEVACAA